MPPKGTKGSQANGGPDLGPSRIVVGRSVEGLPALPRRRFLLNEGPRGEPRRLSPGIFALRHLGVRHPCNRTCVDRVGSHEASRGRPRSPVRSCSHESPHQRALWCAAVRWGLSSGID